MNSTTNRQHNTKGFSMVEILVAVAVMALGLLPVMNVATASLRETSMTREDILVRNVALDLLERYAAAPASQLETAANTDRSDEEAEEAIAQDSVLNGGEASESMNALNALGEPLTVTRRVDFEKDGGGTAGLSLLTVKVTFASQTRGEKSVVMYRFIYQPEAASTIAAAGAAQHGA